MPHVTSGAPRTPQNRRPYFPANGNISSSFIRVIVKTPTKQKDFTVAGDISVRQFKEKLSAHFKCQVDQLVLVFMGRLLKDQDTLSQRGITHGHTIYLVIKSKNGSRSLAHTSQNLPTKDRCHQDRNTEGNSSGVCRPASVSQTPVKSALFVESDAPQVQNQNLGVDSSQHAAQMLGNLRTQQLLSNVEFIQQFISKHLDKQELIQQNPEVAHLLDNSESLWQTLELIRNLAIIQEIVQTQKPAQNLEHLLNLCDLEQSYADFSDQMFYSMQDPLGGNPFTVLLAGQVTRQVQPSPPPPPSFQEQQDQHPHLKATRVICTNSCGLSSVTSTSATPNRLNHTFRANTATISTKGQSCVCATEQPAGIPALPSIEVMQQLQEENEESSISVCSSDQRSEDDPQLSDRQASSQITGGMAQLLMNHPHLAAQITLFMTQLTLDNPKASQAILQIKQGLQLLAPEAPVLLSCFAPYLPDLHWLPGLSCSYPDTPKKAECCYKSGAVLHRLHPQAGNPSQPPQAPEIRFTKQMKFLQTLGFGNYHANLQALIATEGNTNAAICKLKKSQGF
uniref:Ubiquilin like n=1 Tax=Chinchilla lanigera TaxID=34839 RepID=A0A8C2VY92_CHILA